MTKQEYRQWVKRINYACGLIRKSTTLSPTAAREYLDELILYGHTLTPARTEEIIKELESRNNG